MIRKKFWSALILMLLATVILSSQAFTAQEDTAQLTFSKTAITKKKSLRNTYTVQNGDVLSAIIRKIPGVTEKDVPRYYRMIKELNPNITDLNRLSVGQTIMLPGAASSVNALSSETAGSQGYQVKKGDSLIRIVHRELHITTGTQKTLLLIKSMNPNIKNAHKIYIGQMIRLPKGKTLVKDVPVDITPDNVQVMSHREESPVQETPKDVDAKETISLPPAARLAVIKHIITQMNGNMITGGNYYLPVSKTEQLTIDCSVIPVVELDDKTTIFLDLESRSNNHLKKIISDHWSNYHLVKIDTKDDIIVMLKKIFKSTKTHEITKVQKPISVGSLPPLDVMVDWVIAKKNVKTSSSKTQGLRFVYENTPLLPRAIANYARQHSLIITEISPEKGLVGKPEEIYSLPSMTILPISSARDFSLALLAYLNIQGENDADIQIFNTVQDGFNLSIKADIIVTRGEKKTIIFSRILPPQFVNILQKAGHELIFVSDQDAPVKNMEKILRGFNFVFTSGYFTFSGLEKNQPPYNFGFNGTKIKTDKDIYVVDFDFNQELRGLMQETWSANIVRY